MVGLQRGPDLKQPNFRPRVAGKKSQKILFYASKTETSWDYGFS